MNESITTCPRCQYQRQASDNCPDYECPKCGIVYAKFLAVKAQREGQTRPNARSTTIRCDDKEAMIDPPKRPSRGNGLKYLARFHILESLGRFQGPSFGLKHLAIAVSGAVIFGVTALVLAVNFTDYGNLRYRYLGYITAMDNLQFDEAYRYLARSTRQVVSAPEWRFYLESSKNMRSTEVFKSMTFSSDGRSARVISVITVEGKDMRPNYQTWVKEDGGWFRGYIDDNSEAVKKMRRDFNKKENARSYPRLLFVSTSWRVTPQDVVKFLVTPQTNIVITNGGEIPITNLRIKVEYYDKNDQVVMSSAESVAVREGDEPLLAGDKTNKLFLNSDVGFAIRADNSSATTVETIAGRIERRIYFKREATDEWARMSTAHLVEK